MGACFSADAKIRGGTSSAGTRSSRKQQLQPEQKNKAPTTQPQQKDRGSKRRSSGLVPCGRRTDFGYAKDFDSRYSVGKLLGHGQFGYTFVATENATGERVAVKRIDKNKVILQPHMLDFVSLSLQFETKIFKDAYTR